MSSANEALFKRLCELGLLETIEGGAKFLGECNECQAQFIKPHLMTDDDREARIVTISTSVDGFNCSENTSLINPLTRRPIWFEQGVQRPDESDESNSIKTANEILGKHLTEILLMISDGDLDSHSLCSITNEYGDDAVASYVDLDEVDTEWKLCDYNFHLRFSCADLVLGVTGSLESPDSVSLRELRWGADDFAECSYFDEICSDLEMDPGSVV
jgi:hypothetical protein